MFKIFTLVGKGRSAANRLANRQDGPIELNFEGEAKRIHHLAEALVGQADNEIAADEDVRGTMEHAGKAAEFGQRAWLVHLLEHLGVAALDTDFETDTARIADQIEGFLIDRGRNQAVVGGPVDIPATLDDAA